MVLSREFWKNSTKFLNPGMLTDGVNVTLKVQLLFQVSNTYVTLYVTISSYSVRFEFEFWAR